MFSFFFIYINIEGFSFYSLKIINNKILRIIIDFFKNFVFNTKKKTFINLLLRDFKFITFFLIKSLNTRLNIFI